MSEMNPPGAARFNDLITQLIPDGRKALLDSHKNLEELANYCEDHYDSAGSLQEKTQAVEDSKQYAIQSLASVAYMINAMATNALELFDHQYVQLDNLESTIHNIKQNIDIHKEKVARRQIGTMAAAKRNSKVYRITVPNGLDHGQPYQRTLYDINALDSIGYGFKPGGNANSNSLLAGGTNRSFRHASRGSSMNRSAMHHSFASPTDQHNPMYVVVAPVVPPSSAPGSSLSPGLAPVAAPSAPSAHKTPSPKVPTPSPKVPTPSPKVPTAPPKAPTPSPTPPTTYNTPEPPPFSGPLANAAPAPPSASPSSLGGLPPPPMSAPVSICDPPPPPPTSLPPGAMTPPAVPMSPPPSLWQDRPLLLPELGPDSAPYAPPSLPPSLPPSVPPSVPSSPPAGQANGRTSPLLPPMSTEIPMPPPPTEDLDTDIYLRCQIQEGDVSHVDEDMYEDLPEHPPPPEDDSYASTYPFQQDIPPPADDMYEDLPLPPPS